MCISWIADEDNENICSMNNVIHISVVFIFLLGFRGLILFVYVKYYFSYEYEGCCNYIQFHQNGWLRENEEVCLEV